MSKIKTIKLVNFKAIDKFEADFHGCTAIITAGNEKGKTSFLRGIQDRIRFSRPEVMVKQGEEKGKGELTLDTGERFEWDFDVNGKDKLVYYDTEQIKQTVTVELGKRFFPPLFDIDKFLQSAPKDQIKQLQKIVGIDFTEIEGRYDIAYRERTTKNQEAEKFHVKLSKMLEAPKVDFVDLTDLQARKEKERVRLNELYKSNKSSNEDLRKEWERAKEIIDKEVSEHNTKQTSNLLSYNACNDAILVLEINGYVKDQTLIDFLTLKKLAILDQKTASDFYPLKPKYIEEMPDDKELQKIDADILKASEINVEAQKYKDYIDYKTQVDLSKVEADEANVKVREIEEERKRIIESVNFPKGIEITGQGITVDGFPLDKTQISTSKLYTTALRIAAMNLGEVKTLYFDASYLDNKNLSEIEQWAEENNLQLLIERPDRDGGEIKYELIEN